MFYLCLLMGQHIAGLLVTTTAAGGEKQLAGAAVPNEARTCPASSAAGAAAGARSLHTTPKEWVTKV